MIRILALTCCVAFAAHAQDWRYWGGDPGGSRFSKLTQINRNNVRNLKLAWVYHTGEVQPGTNNFDPKRIEPFEATPLVVDGVMYFSTPSGRVVALDPETGKEIWRFDPQAGTSWMRIFHAHRGVTYWQSADGHDRRILFGTLEARISSRLIALDTRTGKPCGDFGAAGSVNLRTGVADHWPEVIYAITSPPAVYKNLVIVGAEVPEHPSEGPSGDVRAFDARTGKLVWTFHTVPRPGEIGSSGWGDGAWIRRTGANVWSIMSVDVERGIVFLPIGSASYDFYGADRKGQNLFANSLVALDAASGRLIWYYQMVHHDLWDYDLPAEPVLITVRRGKREVPAVAQVTKMGLLFILDRTTGRPLFPVQERRVAESNVPGESTWPTQPFPLRPEALSSQTMSASQITTVTRQSNRFCTALFRSLQHRGMYVPYGREMTLVSPGELGGGNWSGGSFEASTGRFFVNTNNLFSIGYLQPQPPGSAERYRRTSEWGEYAFFWDKNQLPCQQPPWGVLSAIDVSTGSVVWKVPLGKLDSLGTETGAPNIGGSIVTAGGLLFIGATIDDKFRAFDTNTGKELWVTRIEAAAHATPMTYLGKTTGKQYVAVATGGGGVFRGKVSDTLVAYALPDTK